MLIYKYLVLFFLLTSQAFAGKAVVIVLETALLEDRAPDARVVQLVRKNQEVWIHDREFGLSPLDPDYETLNNRSQFDELKNIRYDRGEVKAGYLETLDRNGRTAFIKKSHVKLIYKDDREFLTNVNPFIEDPTDYRLQEPLPSDYPLTDPEKRRAFAMAMFGPAPRARYTYVAPVTSTDRGFRKGFAFGYSRKAGFDQYDRLYFGGYGHLLVSETFYTFGPGVMDSSREIAYQVALGPQLTYDAFREDKWKLSVGGGVNLNWNRHFVKNTAVDFESEERLFQGFSFTPRVFTKFHWRKIFIPNVDLFLGIDMQFNLAQNFTNTETPSDEDIWDNKEGGVDAYQVPSGGVMTFLVGFQSNY